MYGLGAGFAGVGSTAIGIAALPNTGGNLALLVLSIATITVGVMVATSFVVTRIATAINR